MATPLFIPPNGTVKLYSRVDIREDQGRQRVFRTPEDRESYFAAHFSLQFNEMSYIRLGNSIKVDATVGGLSNVNFLSFKNATSGTENELYCPIDRKEYVNNNTVEITYHVNWWVSCFEHMTFNPGIVGRQHLSIGDWNAAKLNPWADIFQLQTSEPALSSYPELMETVKFENNNFWQFPIRTPWLEGAEDMHLVMVLGITNVSDYGVLEAILTTQIVQNGGFYYNLSSDNSNFYFIQGVPAVSCIIGLTLENENNKRIWKRIFDELAKNDITGNIMGLYYIPKFYTENIYNDPLSPNLPSDPLTLQVPAKNNMYDPENPKLFRYPYNYVEVGDGNTKAKAFACEDFLEVREGSSDYVKFRSIFNLNGIPSIVMAPYMYMENLAKKNAAGVEEGWIYKLNFEHGMYLDEIPHIPYATDGYVSYIASFANGNTNNAGSLIANTITSAGQMQANANIADISAQLSGGSSLAVRNATAGMTTPGQIGLAAMGINAGKELIQGAARSYYNIGRSEIAGQDSAASVIQGFAMGVPISQMLRPHPDVVTPGSPKGFLGYMRDPLRFNVKQFFLRSDILAVYDTWMNYMGYADGRIGIPYICNYASGSTNPEEIPHFAHIGVDNVTYAQANISVTTGGKAPEAACSYVEAMFAAGTLFVTNELDPEISALEEINNGEIL